MAIKSSNQITFTEHKKIVEIKEWYLATSAGSGVTTETAGWTEDIQTINYTNKYLWNYEEVVYSIGSSDISEPVVIGVYGETGSSLQVKYISSATIPTIINNDVSAWLDTIPTPIDGQKIYMTQKLSTNIDWSTPIQISATDGATPTITIIDGYWYINGESTGVKVEGTSGDAPEITIGANGNWFINGVDSGTKAQGEAGKDGASIEYVYYRSEDELELEAPSYTNDVLTSGWTDSPQGITEIYKYEYVSVRTKPSGGTWDAFSTPVIWSKWGEKGQDGDGVEYRYYLSNSSTVPTYIIGDSKWTDDPQGVSIDQQYEYVVQIKTSDGVSSTSNPSLWAKFGEDGIGISEIKNYYCTTLNPTLPDNSQWEEIVPQLTPTNKYLWNYEVITYTDDTTTSTDPAIIGVYGDSGTNAVVFEIYSTQGFMFKEKLKSIELKIAAFEGTESIVDATYTWSWWDDSLNNGSGGYSVIVENTTAQSIIINEADEYALASLKCTINYDGNVYDDYVVLTSETVIYTSVVKFFDGSNIFNAEDLYIIAYVDLYQNNDKIETISSTTYCTGVASVSSSGIIATDLAGDFSNGDKVYFVYQNDDGLYEAVLGEYASGTWTTIDEDLQYTYTNTLYPTIQSNVIVISKESINKSQNIDFTIYKDGAYISSTNAIVIDINDPIVSITAPENPNYGQLWLDTSTNPYSLKIYTQIEGTDTGEWIYFVQQNGKTVYTSQPSEYSEGDLWILADGETCGDFGPGSMLKATTNSDTFNENHWVDADEEATELKNNIKQYFGFDPDTGLKIGQTDENFYVNISSTEMGFYDNTGTTAKKVVSISNQSAVIKNITVEESAEFDCNVTFNQQVNFFGFIWKKESNGSMSLAADS